MHFKKNKKYFFEKLECDMIIVGENMKKLIGKMDLWLFLIMIILSAFGLVMIFSSSSIAAVLRYKVSTSYFFRKQLIVIIAGFLVGLILIIRIPTKVYRPFAATLAIGIMAVLALLFLYGQVTNGAQSWYRNGIFAIQPAEFAKSIMIICMAVFYNEIYNHKQKTKFAPILPLGFGLAIAVLIALQPDLGGAIIVAGITGLLFLAIPLNKKLKKDIYKILGIGVGLGAIVLLLSGKSLLNSMQSSRLNFLNPCSRYMEDTGYQVCNGYIAIHNGGLFGVGLGNSTQKYLYLPESHTDFIFPIICEELGVLAGIGIILIYAVMLYRIFVIAKKAHNIQNSVLAYGTFLFLLAHISVNLLGVLGLIPLTGVPLPFLSYGGSFTINILIMLFVVQRVAIETYDENIHQKVKNT